MSQINVYSKMYEFYWIMAVWLNSNKCSELLEIAVLLLVFITKIRLSIKNSAVTIRLEFTGPVSVTGTEEALLQCLLGRSAGVRAFTGQI